MHENTRARACLPPKAPVQGRDWQWPLKGCVNCDERRPLWSSFGRWRRQRSLLRRSMQKRDKEDLGLLVITIAVIVN